MLRRALTMGENVLVFPLDIRIAEDDGVAKGPAEVLIWPLIGGERPHPTRRRRNYTPTVGDPYLQST
jgi:hypothetical protein